MNENDSTIRKAYTFAARGRHPAPPKEDGTAAAAAAAQYLRGGCSLNLAIVWCYLMLLSVRRLLGGMRRCRRRNTIDRRMKS